METGLTKAQVISALTMSPHGELGKYLPVFNPAAQEDPDFYAHLIAWNHHKGEVRDAKAALPMIALQYASPDAVGHHVLQENALAHLADLTPKLLVQALDFGQQLAIPHRYRLLRSFVERYLRDLEADPRDFDNAGVQHRESLRRLYTAYRVSHPRARVTVIEAHSQEGKYGIVKQLPSMSAVEIAGAIDRYKLPWLVVRGALGARAKEPDVLMAIIDRMTPVDLVTNTKMLLKAGVKDHAQTRAAYEQKLTQAGRRKPKTGGVLKTKVAAKAVADAGDAKTAGKLQALQERQLDELRTIEGNWLVIGDKSSSMTHTIIAAKQVAAVLARLVKGQVHLVFADTDPKPVGNVSGKTLEVIELATAGVIAKGGTSLGCALAYAREQKLQLDGIAVVSDGAENTPPQLAREYDQYARQFDKRPAVYWYRTMHDSDFRTPTWIQNFQATMAAVGANMTEIDLRRGVDYYSLPNVVQTMRVGKYDQLAEIMNTKLRTLDEVLTRTVGQWVSGHRKVRA